MSVVLKLFIMVKVIFLAKIIYLIANWASTQQPVN